MTKTRFNEAAMEEPNSPDGEPDDAIQGAEEPIRVLVRVRPLENKREASTPALLQVESNDTLKVTKGSGGARCSRRARCARALPPCSIPT